MRSGELRRRALRLLVRGSGNGRARGVLRVWPVWERVARRLWPAVAIEGSRHGWISLHFHEYRSEAFLLPDGVEIGRGDTVADIHFNNHVLVELLGPARGSDKWKVATIFREELEALAKWCQDADFPHPRLKAIHGTSILSRGGRRLGFTVKPVPTGFRARLDGTFLAGLVIIYGSEGVGRAGVGRTLGGPPAEVWMSRSALMRRYGGRADSG